MIKKILAIIFVLLLLYAPALTKAVTEDELKKQIDELQSKISQVQSQAQTLAGQIALYDNQIKLTVLKITQTEQQIETFTSKIQNLESRLQDKSKLLEQQIVQTYKRGGFDELQLLFASANTSELISRFKYLQTIQNNNRKTLHDLQTVQTNYSSQKDLIEESRKRLTVQQSSLESLKVQRQTLLTQTKNNEANYQKLLSQAKAELANLRRFVISQGGASILSNQTKCDSWGCYYNQRDLLWGNIGLGGSSYSVAEYGCLVSSVSMIASHQGKNIKPSDIAAVYSAFVTGTGLLSWQPFSVNGTVVSVSSASKSQLDQKLASGPVIAGLYGGPDHFIVILKKEGSNYIMHDPFMENGSNRPLTDKYSVSDITTLRLVSFN